MDYGVSQDREKKLLERLILTENCIVAEIHRIASITPREFFEPTASALFSKIIVDFAYFENKALLEKYEGHNADEEFYNRYSGYLRDFARLLDAICNFFFDYQEYTEKFNPSQLKGLLDLKTNSLRCETLYLLGVILLLLEDKFPGAVKERVFVAYYRSSVEFPSTNLDLLVSLLRNRKEPFETCLSHLRLNTAFIDNVINVLKTYTIIEASSDLYQDKFNTEKQCAMIYTCLYFKPDYLQNQYAFMRQIVDKYFADKWILSLHFELKVDICQKWDSYKAASGALSNTVDTSVISRNASGKSAAIRALQLPGGLLSVENFGDYSKVILEYNNHLRWLILHSGNGSKAKKYTSLIAAANTATRLSSKDLLHFLIKLASFECKFYQSCRHLISRKREDCTRLKSRVFSIIDQVIAFLTNPIATGNIRWNEKLKSWLHTIKQSIVDLDMESADAPHILEHMQTKITEVSELHTGDLIILRQYFTMVVSHLNRLMNVCLVDNAFVERICERTDSVYLLYFLDESIQQLEILLKQDALSVKYIFLKISASIANLVRIIGDPVKRDALSTFYHKQLERRLRRIIQVIPRAIFIGMEELQSIYSPTSTIHVEKHHIKQFADLGRRRLLAQKTSEIAKLSLGISNMCISKLGGVEIQPRDLLIDGLREELHMKVQKILNTPEDNVFKTLAVQTKKFHAFRKAFLLVCEHIGINAVAMWREQVEDIIGSTIHSRRTQACSVAPSSSQQMLAKKFSGTQIMDYVLAATNPRTTVYNTFRQEWRSVGGNKPEFSVDFFTVLESWCPGTVLSGLHTAFSSGILALMKEFLHEVEKSSATLQTIPLEFNHKFIDSLTNTPGFIGLHRKLLPLYTKIGHLTILRETLKFVMEGNQKTQMATIFNASQNFLRACNIELENQEGSISKQPNLAGYFINLGLESTAVKKDERNSRNLAVVLFCSLVLYFTSNVISNKKSEFVDTYAMVCGLVTVIKRLGLWDKFTTLADVFLTDANVLGLIRQFKTTALMLPISKVGLCRS
ncbi:hereditary spastic paraplegia protein strumpellin domain-containing protein [Ditylenchus destructor]|uniref:Hereditary spastic paraplegia protein strumpellin domain-containing protein n=1 Tax=Ditylenchus destructor TaxID=166010 RepID=A0AAD4MXY3_9BILA|nr:hereditary spastic paraplegia protein strumpellin domain-containing protein [Ditylenchus destructor]